MKRIVKIIGVLLLLFISSCKESEDIVVPTDVSLNEYSFKELGTIYSRLKNEFDNNPQIINTIRENYDVTSRNNTSNNNYIDQEALDYLLDVAGVGEFSISLEQVNLIIEENIKANNLGAKNYIENNLEVNLSTKAYLKEIIVDQKFIPNLELKQQFSNLPLNEKEMLTKVNEFAYEFNNLDQSENRMNTEGFYTGSSIGTAAGMIACGGPCGLIGWAIGGLIGAAIK